MGSRKTAGNDLRHYSNGIKLMFLDIVSINHYLKYKTYFKFK